MPEANYLLSVSWGYIKVCIESARKCCVVWVSVRASVRLLTLRVCSAAPVVWGTLRNGHHRCVWGPSAGMRSIGFPFGLFGLNGFSFTQM